MLQNRYQKILFTVNLKFVNIFGKVFVFFHNFQTKTKHKEKFLQNFCRINMIRKTFQKLFYLAM